MQKVFSPSVTSESREERAVSTGRTSSSWLSSGSTMPSTRSTGHAASASSARSALASRLHSSSTSATLSTVATSGTFSAAVHAAVHARSSMRTGGAASSVGSRPARSSCDRVNTSMLSDGSTTATVRRQRRRYARPYGVVKSVNGSTPARSGACRHVV
jgi:hypothetical protein